MIPLPRSRHLRRLLWLAAVAAFIALLAVLVTVGEEGEEPAPLPTLPPALIHPEPTSLTTAAVVEVIDGDTIDVEIEGRRERVRYYGVDAPEKGHACYNEATARNGVLATGRVLLLPDARERDPNGRLLRYVFTLDGQSVDAQLIAEGLGQAWREDGAYRDRLISLEEQAQREGLGCLWVGEQ